MKRISFLVVCSSLALFACSSSSSPAAAPDDSGAAVVDSFGESTPGDSAPVTDSKTTKDSTPKEGSVDDGGGLCDVPLAPGYACPAAPSRPTGSTACDEATLQDFALKCIHADTSSVPAECAGWKTANAACNTCIEAFAYDPKVDSLLVYPDSLKCYWWVFSDTCRKTVNCSYDCQDQVCGTCDTAPGTSPDGSQPAYDDCTTRAIDKGPPKGVCYDVAGKDADACFTSTDTHACETPEVNSATPDVTKMRNEIIVFYRGACRDGASWAHADSPSSTGDAGPSDAPADGG